MSTRVFCVLVVLALAAVAPSAHGASISFIPASPTTGLRQGDVFALQVWLDFSDVLDSSGTPVGTLGGAWNIEFDSSAVAFFGLDYIAIGDPAFGRQPDILDGLLESWAAAAFDGIIGPVMAGTVEFEVLATPPFSTTIDLAATNGLGGPWVHGGDFVTIVNVDYGSVTVTGIPLPAAIWFMLGGLAGLAVVRDPLARGRER